MTNIITLIFTIIPLSIAFLVSEKSISIFGSPLIIICVLLSFLIHWLAFIPSFIYKTEKYYDFTGMLAFIMTTLTALYFKGSMIDNVDFTSKFLACLIIIWTLRLGLFLFYRISKEGKDSRFDEIKHSFPRFLMTWTLSAAWVSITSISALVVITSESKINDIYFLVIGGFIWLFGIVFEIISDYQKTNFKNNPENKDQFISSGLWSLSRHPNYFGEIILWIGIFVITFPHLDKFQFFSVASPLFVYFLLTRVSGINLLEAKADKKWGTSDEYKKYRSQTPQLIPKFWN